MRTAALSSMYLHPGSLLQLPLPWLCIHSKQNMVKLMEQTAKVGSCADAIRGTAKDLASVWPDCPSLAGPSSRQGQRMGGHAEAIHDGWDGRRTILSSRASFPLAAMKASNTAGSLSSGGALDGGRHSSGCPQHLRSSISRLRLAVSGWLRPVRQRIHSLRVRWARTPRLH